MRIKVSVIVPAFNEEKLIARTLSSIASQTYRDFECIVVDNASTDATGEIARRFPFRVVLETRKGYMNAAMRGAAESTGELLTFCDADTLYPRTWLSRIVRTFERNPRATAVYGPCRSHDASALINGVSGFFFTQWLRISRILGLDNTCGFNFVIRRDAFDAVGGYDPLHVKMSPDVELGQRLAKVGPVVLRSDILVEASTRRFQKEGFLPTLWMFMKVWVQILRRGEPKTTYAEYNKEIR